VGAAATLAYFAAGWGAAYYLIDLVAVFSLVLVFMKRYSQRLLFSYSITFGLGLFVAIAVPFLSPAYLSTATVLPVALVFAVLCIAEVLRAQITIRTKTLLAVGALGVGVVAVVLLAVFGDLTSIAGKFISVLDPFQRASQPLIESVAEHRITAWGSMYYELGIGILFFLTGIYFTLKTPTNRNVFLLLFGMTTLYFASSMVRLLVILAPAFAIIMAIGVLGLLKPFFTLNREIGSQSTMKAKRRLQRVGKEYGAIAIVLIFTLLISTYAFSIQNGTPRVYNTAYSPLAISVASLPLGQISEQIPTWLNTISYTKTNLNSTDVIAAWWDYGDWLSIAGNVTTLCDNTTVNGTQIENVAYAFMANETQAIKMLEKYDAKYVLVYVVLKLDASNNQLTGNVSFSGYGDDGKWMWMAKISGGAASRLLNEGFMTENYTWTDEYNFGNYTEEGGAWNYNDMGLNTTLYKIASDMQQKWATSQGFTVSNEKASSLQYFVEEYISGLEITYTQAAYEYNTYVPLVGLYEIDYDAYYNATSTTP